MTLLLPGATALAAWACADAPTAPLTPRPELLFCSEDPRDFDRFAPCHPHGNGPDGSGDTAVVRIMPDAWIIAPAGLRSSGGPPVLGGIPMDTLLRLTISVDSAGMRLHNRTVTLSLEALDSAGAASDSFYGHFHQGHGGAAKPVGRLSHTTRNTGTDTAVVTYYAGPVSGPVIVRGVSPGAHDGTTRLAVGVLGLVPLVERLQVDTLIGILPEHASSHWGLPALVVRLDSLADTFHVRYGARLEFKRHELASRREVRSGEDVGPE